MNSLSTFLSVLLIPLVVVMPVRAELDLPADSASGAAVVATTGSTTPGQTNVLKIRLADESKATVNASSIVKGYSILITDGAGLPVADVAVAIRFPDDGPTGFFVNGEHSGVAYTDASGVAKFPQVNWGANPGSVTIRVTAAKGDVHAGALIEQNIVAPVTPAAEPPAAVATANPKTPGVPTSVAAVHSGATPAPVQTPGSNGAGNGPSTETSASPDSGVSVVNTAGNQGNHSTKKWIILAAVIAGVGAGAALAMAGHGGSTPTTAAATTTIGTPTINVGH